MSRFYVGQRVRMVRPVHPVNAGLEGVIVELFPESQVLGGAVNCVCVWDRKPVGYFSHTEQLEPILYDGNQLVSWEECLWQPEGQAA